MSQNTQDAPSFSQQQYDWLAKAFPAIEVTPRTPPADIMYNAGEQNVLRSIKRRVVGWREQRVS